MYYMWECLVPMKTVPWMSLDFPPLKHYGAAPFFLFSPPSFSTAAGILSTCCTP